ncbi:hypothetical protein AB7783_06855 [Tardiphaga sp. 172_B4_N1_3]|uniref:hypothetical protein n=1 Tax=Tardiphaga sp. 172_B4_N1_3 TaxID=3240787 RepID=UPI003F891CFA
MSADFDFGELIEDAVTSRSLAATSAGYEVVKKMDAVDHGDISSSGRRERRIAFIRQCWRQAARPSGRYVEERRFDVERATDGGANECVEHIVPPLVMITEIGDRLRFSCLRE